MFGSHIFYFRFGSHIFFPRLFLEVTFSILDLEVTFSKERCISMVLEVTFPNMGLRNKFLEVTFSKERKISKLLEVTLFNWKSHFSLGSHTFHLEVTLSNKDIWSNSLEVTLSNKGISSKCLEVTFSSSNRILEVSFSFAVQKSWKTQISDFGGHISLGWLGRSGRFAPTSKI